MPAVSAPGPRGTSVVVTVYARGDRVLLRVGTGPTANLSVEQAGDLLDALRTAFDQAATAKLDSLPRTGRTARPGQAGRSAGGGGDEHGGVR